MSSPSGSQSEPSFDEREFALRAVFENEHYWHVHRRRVLGEVLASYRSPAQAGPLLDLGCGIGTVATHLNQLGYRVDYADFYRSAVELARGRAQAALGDMARARSFQRVDATQPLELTTNYEGILMLDVLEHLADDRAVLGNLRHALGEARAAPSRRFVMLTAPAFGFLWSPWDELEHHKRRYERGELESKLREAGFEPVRSSHFFGPLFFAALGTKVLRSARAALRGAQRAGAITDLVESKSVAWLNRGALAVLAPERKWLARGSDLSFGTSVLVIAEAK